MKSKRVKLPLTYTAQIELCRSAKRRLLKEYEANKAVPYMLGGLCYYFGGTIEAWYPNVKTNLIRKFIPTFTRDNAIQFANAKHIDPISDHVFSADNYWWNMYRGSSGNEIKTIEYDLANRILFIDWLIKDATEKRKQQTQIKKLA